MTAGRAGHRDPDASLPGGPEPAGGPGLALLEDRIRSATRAAAAEVAAGSIRPLRLQPRRRAEQRRRPAADRTRPAADRTRPGAGRSWPGRASCLWAGARRQGLVPLAAAASVLAVLGGVVSLAPGTLGTTAASPRGVVQPHRATGLRGPLKAPGTAQPPSTGQPSGTAQLNAPGQQAHGTPARHEDGTTPGTSPPEAVQHVRGPAVVVQGSGPGQATRLAGLASAAAAAAATAGIPAYYVALTRAASQPADGAVADDVEVYSSRTGAGLARVSPPAGFRSFVQVSAAADDRTFALAVQYKPAGPPAPGAIVTVPVQAGPAAVASTPAGRSGLAPVSAAVLARPGSAWVADVTARVTFFILRLSPSGQRTQLTEVPGLSVPAGGWLDGIALSPDARQLAVAFQRGGGGARDPGEIQVGSVATGQVRTWNGSGGAVLGSVYPQTLSWTADSRTLAFNWSAFGPQASQRAAGLRLLHPGAPPGDLLARSRLALHWDVSTGTAAAGVMTGAAQITPDGRAILAALELATAGQPLPAAGGGLAGYAAYSPATGTLRAVLDLPPVTGDPGLTRVLWSGTSGRTLIVEYPAGRGQIAVLRDGVLTTLPQPAGAEFPMAAW
jgi:hypothetical protein